MLKKIKYSILFTFVVLILLSVTFGSLAVSKPVNLVKGKGVSIPINPIGNGKWSGLAITVFATEDTELFDGCLDTLLANGFTEIRLNMCGYTNAGYLAILKAAAIRAVAKGVKVIWGVGAGEATLTADSWVDYRLAILDLAAWSQSNAIFEFQLGNEEESHNDNTTLTDSQLRNNLKSVATEVQAIFTRGNISYSCSADSIDSWISTGKGDIDILAANIYRGGESFYGDGWKTQIDNLVAAFGATGTYLSEFSLSWSSLNDYSTDEAVQAVAIDEMVEYIKTSEMTRAFIFCYKYPWSDGYGVLKTDGTYRKLWNTLTSNDAV